MSKKVEIEVKELVNLFLHGRPYGFTSDKEEIYKLIISLPEDERSCVIENQAWNVGYNGCHLPVLSLGMFRLWNREDWINCNNHNLTARNNIDNKLAELRERRQHIKECVKRSLLKTGVVEMVADMLISSSQDSQLEMLYNNLSEGEK